MLHCGLKTLDELNTIKEVERSLATPRTAVIRDRDPSRNNPSEPISFSLSSPVTSENPSINFDPSDPFWASLLGLSLVRGTSRGTP